MKAVRALWRSGLAVLVSPGLTRYWGALPYWCRGRVPFPAHPPPALAWRRIGVIRLDGLGDLVVGTGFLRELRRSFPAARITLVVRHEWLPLVERCPHIDEALGFSRRAYRRFAELRWHGAVVRLCFGKLWWRRFDCILLPQSQFGYYDTRPMAFLSGCGTRLGWLDDSLPVTPREVAARRLLSRAYSMPPGLHEAEKGYRFLELIGGHVERRHLELWWDGEDEQAAATRLARCGEGPHARWVALGLAASHPEKRWPIDRFVALADWLATTHQARVVAVGGEDVAADAARLTSACRTTALNLTGVLTLRQTAAVLARCHLYVGNDSGPMHLAAAARVPVVEISGWPAHAAPDHPSSPHRIGPWCAYRVIVQPELAPAGPETSAAAVTLAQVQAAVTTLLHDAPARSSALYALGPASSLA